MKYFLKGINLTLIFLMLSSFLNSALFAQQEKEPRILFLVDASGSMNLPWTDQQNRYDAAKDIINKFLDESNLESNKISYAVRMFGAYYGAIEENCYDTKLEVPFRYQNARQIRARMNDISPRGYSPIAYSLEKAATEDFIEDDKYAYSLILITDGDESCDGDICKIMNELLNKKISFEPYIISLVNEDPLREFYECLGNYMVVENHNDINRVVNKILVDNHDILKITPKTDVVIERPKPVVPVVEEIKPPVRETVPVIIDTPIVEEVVIETPITIEPTPEPNTPKVEEVVVQTREKITINKRPLIIKPSRVSLKSIQAPILTFVKPPTNPIAIPEEEKPVEVVQAPRPRVEIPPMAPAEPKQRPQPKAVGKITDFFLDKEDADKTTIEVYFTDGHGKFYWTEPRVQIYNTSDNTLAKEFHRHVNGGVPKGIEIEPGTYNFTVPNSNSSASNVVIEENKVNKVYLRVIQGSLAFYHPEAPDIAISQYTALVSKRFVRNSPVVSHPCDTILSYDPSNYHIEINTLPPLMYNLDIDFTSTKMVAIPQPGYMQVTNTNRAGLVELWYNRGGQFVKFHEMIVTGYLEDQLRELLPGSYQLRYTPVGVKYAGASIQAIPFIVKGKETTNIQIP